MEVFSVSKKEIFKAIVWIIILDGLLLVFILSISKSESIDDLLKLFFIFVWICLFVYTILDIKNVGKCRIKIDKHGFVLKGKGLIKYYNSNISFDGIKGIKYKKTFCLSYPLVKIITIYTEYTKVDIEISMFDEYKEIVKIIYNSSKDNKGFFVDEDVKKTLK